VLGGGGWILLRSCAVSYLDISGVKTWRVSQLVSVLVHHHSMFLFHHSSMFVYNHFSSSLFHDWYTFLFHQCSQFLFLHWSIFLCHHVPSFCFTIVPNFCVTTVPNSFFFKGSFSFYRCAMHFEIYAVHTPTSALFINLVKSFKFTLKYTVISLLHVLVFNDHHQGALSVPN